MSFRFGDCLDFIFLHYDFVLVIELLVFLMKIELVTFFFVKFWLDVLGLVG